MRRRTLLTQVLIANLMLITLAVVATVFVTNPSIDVQGGAVVLVLAVLFTVVVNVAMLQQRFRPLERLVGAMERADLTGPGARGLLEDDGDVPEDVIRLEQAFKRMLARLEAERRRASSAALDAQEKERARIARDLHDEVNQSLTGLLLRLEAVRSHASPELAAELTEIRGVANQAMEELLALSRHLRPTALDDLGLKAALAGHVEAIGRQTDLEATFRFEGSFTDLAAEAQLVTYRIAQEAISNAIQHAGADRLEVTLRRIGEGVDLQVLDNGAGINGSAPGHGISGMRERAMLAGGHLDLRSTPGQGTTVSLRI